jgi:hypothetical protein
MQLHFFWNNILTLCSLKASSFITVSQLEVHNDVIALNTCTRLLIGF